MAIYYARKAGNIDATDVWATTPSGTAAAVTFAEGDVLMANSFTVTVNVSTNLGATGEVRTNNAHGATNGGTFRLNNGVTLTANVFSGGGAGISTVSPTSATLVGNVTAGSTNALVKGCDHNSTGTLTIFGNVTSGSGDTNDGAFNRSTGTLTIQGNVTAVGNNSPGAANNVGGILNITGNVQGGGFGARGALNNAAGQINIFGNVTGGNNASNSFGVRNNSTGTIVITGNVTGGTNSAAFGASNASTGNITIIGLCNGSGAAVGCRNEVGGTITITGAATGGTTSTAYGLQNAGVGIVTINGSAIGGTAATGARNESTGIIRLTRAVGNAFGFDSTGLTAASGVVNVGLGEVELEQIEYGTRGQSPTAGVIKLKSLSTNAAVFNFTNTASQKTLGEAPAISDVRQGTTYALGTLTGTCAVPAAASVGFGVPVDNTTGTAVLTPAAIRSELSVELGRIDAAISSRLAPSGTLATVTTLTNAPTVPTPAQIASQVRTELSSELAKVSALNTTRLGQCTTTEILGNLLAQANS
jgi:ethanolamine utilization microcompartment shell protein EutS